MMYAANSQGDSHIMTLLRAYGCPLYDENGNFSVNTPEGIQALPGSREMDQQGDHSQRGGEPGTADCVNLFYNQQLAMCVGNLTNLWDARNKGVDVFTANFPPTLRARVSAPLPATASACLTTGMKQNTGCQGLSQLPPVGRGGDEVYAGTLPVSKSVTQQYQDEIWMLKAYGENTADTWTISAAASTGRASGMCFTGTSTICSPGKNRRRRRRRPSTKAATPPWNRGVRPMRKAETKKTESGYGNEKRRDSI